jgi:RimJ/RimL family protein N-acetyltransferase
VGPRARTLAGRFVRLEPLRPEADAEELYPVSHGSPELERVWTYMAYGPFPGEGAMREWLERCAASSDPLFLAAVEQSSGRRVGMVSFLNVVPEMRRLEIGNIWYATRVHRSRINTEAAWLMLRHAFDELACRRVEWKCDALNAASRRAARRLGFAYEGVFRQHLIVKGRNRDTAWYAMLDGEWPLRRRHLERWLEGEGLSLSALNSDRRDG